MVADALYGYVCVQLIHPNLNRNWFADVAWTIALYIEAVAILPQLFMFQKRVRLLIGSFFSVHAGRNV